MTKEKKLYVSITAGEENYYFTKDEGLQLLSSEFNRVEQEKGENEMPYECEFVWLTDEEYAEMSSNPDKPDFLTPSGDVQERAKGMQWVKASEMLPKSKKVNGGILACNGFYFCKCEDDCVDVCQFKPEWGEFRHITIGCECQDYKEEKADVIYWLDESGASSRQGEVESLKHALEDIIGLKHNTAEPDVVLDFAFKIAETELKALNKQ